jgi:hypothetical protein
MQEFFPSTPEGVLKVATVSSRKYEIDENALQIDKKLREGACVGSVRAL